MGVVEIDPRDVDALRRLSVSAETLSEAGRGSLDANGFLVVPELLPLVQVQRLADLLEARMQALGPAATVSESGVERFPSPVLDDVELAVCWQHPVAVAAAVHILAAPFRKRGVTARNPQPGHGAQGLHQDAPSPVGEYLGVNVIWCIDSFTPESGAPRAIPGSHRSSEPPFDVEEFGGGMKPHPEEVHLTGGPGTAIIWNARLWHSGRQNYSGGRRRSLGAYFSRAS